MSKVWACCWPYLFVLSLVLKTVDPSVGFMAMAPLILNSASVNHPNTSPGFSVSIVRSPVSSLIRYMSKTCGFLLFRPTSTCEYTCHEQVTSKRLDSSRRLCRILSFWQQNTRHYKLHDQATPQRHDSSIGNMVSLCIDAHLCSQVRGLGSVKATPSQQQERLEHLH